MVILTPRRSSARARAEALLSASLTHSPFTLFLTRPHDREQPITVYQQNLKKGAERVSNRPLLQATAALRKQVGVLNEQS